MSNLSQFGFGGGIKSIQRGTVLLPRPTTGGATTQTATIIPVNTSKSILYYLGVRNGLTSINLNIGGTAGGGILAMIELTNSTTITATIGRSLGNIGSLYSTSPPTVSWQLVEYY